jgi:Tfp pilus assembly protein PilP
MKNQNFKTLILAIPLLILSMACSQTLAAQKAAVDLKTAAAAKPEPKNAAKKPGTPVDPKAEAEEIKPLTVPAGFHYRPDGRRDPFVNPVAMKAPAAAEPGPTKPIIRPDGLPGVLVSEVRLSGIVRAQDVAMTKAILSVGRKTYFARQGDNLFDGVIKEIRPNEVVFMMKANSSKETSNKELTVSTGGRTSVALAGEKK